MSHSDPLKQVEHLSLPGITSERDALLAENQRLREDGYREGFDCGFTTAMAAVRQAIERDLAIHENMEIMRGRRPSEALAGDTE